MRESRKNKNKGRINNIEKNKNKGVLMGFICVGFYLFCFFFSHWVFLVGKKRSSEVSKTRTMFITIIKTIQDKMVMSFTNKTKQRD
jgi:hypothetical protein